MTNETKTGRRTKRVPRHEDKAIHSYEDKAIHAAPEDRADAPEIALCGHCGRECRALGQFCGTRCATLYWRAREG